MVDRDDLVPAYAEWIDRVTATYEAVSYTCRVRLGDPAVAEGVAVHVAGGLVARPGVFRYWGLPYSGRIAKLAEAGIEDALAGRARRGSFGALRDDLTDLPPALQTVFVLCCVEGVDDDELAAACACDVPDAAQRRATVLRHMSELAVRHVGDPTEGE
ncbi:hypothetical protein [Actinomycetospora sp. NBRC 106378]|uniref:hypothetical protein n=1 Tax=Actinomycetospora sp. NBRC 106378 TaxID=3032208 RepID=UPI0024A09BA0|nr:hypothetical protein [Actinomycetospora sp. NBRC 106378]GLZ56208.1 hypothetical protein Acsp07_58250 [Actinomycetospora sp. NBRC 106378]